jgi:phage shock protein PspC (stress-responsive transcriptional regulator)
VLPIRPSTPMLGFGLGFFGGVAQLFQVGQQLAALLVVFQVLITSSSD